MTPQFTIKQYIELRIEVKFNALKGEPMTHDYPGSPAEVEITDLEFAGKSLPNWLFEKILKEKRDELEEACWDYLEETGKEVNYGYK